MLAVSTSSHFDILAAKQRKQNDTGEHLVFMSLVRTGSNISTVQILLTDVQFQYVFRLQMSMVVTPLQAKPHSALSLGWRHNHE